MTSLCMCVCMYVCTYGRAPRWLLNGVTDGIHIQHHLVYFPRSGPDKYKHSSSKYETPQMSPQNKMPIFSKTSVTISTTFR
jgi:hypothetical protein